MPPISAEDSYRILHLLFVDFASSSVDLPCIYLFRMTSKGVDEWFGTNLRRIMNSHLRATNPVVSRAWLVSVMQPLDPKTMDAFVHALHAKGGLTYEDKPLPPHSAPEHSSETDPNPLAVAAYRGASVDTLSKLMDVSHHRHYPPAASVARAHAAAATVCKAMVDEALAEDPDAEFVDSERIGRCLAGVVLCPGLSEETRSAYVRALSRHKASRSKFYHLVEQSIRTGPYNVHQRALYAARGDPIGGLWGELITPEHKALCGLSKECAASVLALSDSRLEIGCDANMLETAAKEWSTGWFPLIWEHYSCVTQQEVVDVCRRLLSQPTPCTHATGHILKTCQADITGYPFAQMVLGVHGVNDIWREKRHLAVSCMLQHAGVRAFVAVGSLHCKTLVEALYSSDHQSVKYLVEALPKECLEWRSSRGNTLMHVAFKGMYPGWRLCVDLLPQELLYVANDEGVVPATKRGWSRA